ncbi:hypothetical protein ACFQ3B_16315 [Stackebrandtia endophytica]|uniref:hypothetical protein n=1 Tax=Stackebrandtia endophytica TaxID=1496996 RepID=UPI00114F8B84|nr:hypothetical protein [Stackebrandtia endophytica]
MPQLDLIIDTYVHADPETVAIRVADPALAAQLWMDWTVEVAEQRGVEGVRWNLADSRVVGSTEVWIEPCGGHSLLHTFVRVDRATGPWPRWRAAWLRRRTRSRLSRTLWNLKDEVEAVASGLDRHAGS